jgi:hypothetical protein
VSQGNGIPSVLTETTLIGHSHTHIWVRGGKQNTKSLKRGIAA